MKIITDGYINEHDEHDYQHLSIDHKTTITHRTMPKTTGLNSKTLNDNNWEPWSFLMG